MKSSLLEFCIELLIDGSKFEFRGNYCYRSVTKRYHRGRAYYTENFVTKLFVVSVTLSLEFQLSQSQIRNISDVRYFSDIFQIFLYN